MMNFKTGVLIDSLGLPFKEALEKVSTLSIDGIQVYATQHHMSSEQLDFSKAKEIKKQVESYNLEISALVGDLGGHGFELESENKEKISKMKAIVDFAQELETNIVTTHIGVISENDSEKYSVMQEALRKICSYSKRAGVYIAVETGPEKSHVLKKFIEDTGEDYLRVNFDPANIVMVQGEDVSSAVENLKEHIVYTHAKDGKMIKKSDPVRIYKAFAEGNPEKLDFDDYFVELMLGTGDVNFPKYLKALENIGYTGFLTIEREAGNNRFEDISCGVDFLRKLMQG